MQRRNAALNYHYFIVLLVGVLLSTVSRRIEPLFAVLPLAVALLYSRLYWTVPQVTVQCQVPSLRAFEGDAMMVQLTVTATTSVPPLELWHYLPVDAACPSGRNRVLITLSPGQVKTFQHEVVFTRRGKYQLGQIFCRAHTPTDLQPWLAEYRYDHLLHVYPRVAPLPRRVLPAHTQMSFGNYVSRSPGEGLEFAGIRPYYSGDRLRRVHWRTSLVRQELYVNDYNRERNADVVILVDTLVSVGTRQANTLDMAVRLAASLAAHYLYQKDRVGLVNYGGVCTWISPAVGQLQLYRILDALLETRTHFSYLTKDIALIPPRVLPSRALIFVLTPFVDTRIEAALHDLLARDFQLVLVALSPLSMAPEAPHPRHAEAAQRLWRLEMDWRLHAFRRLGVPVVVQESADPLQDLHQAMARGRR